MTHSDIGVLAAFKFAESLFSERVEFSRRSVALDLAIPKFRVILRKPCTKSRKLLGRKLLHVVLNQDLTLYPFGSANGPCRYCAGLATNVRLFSSDEK